MLNGRNVIEGEHCYVALDENGLASLTFPNVKCEDGGMYTAIATNKLGKAVSEAPIMGKIIHESVLHNGKIFPFQDIP